MSEPARRVYLVRYRDGGQVTFLAHEARWGDGTVAFHDADGRRLGEPMSLRDIVSVTKSDRVRW